MDITRRCLLTYAVGLMAGGSLLLAGCEPAALVTLQPVQEPTMPPTASSEPAKSLHFRPDRDVAGDAHPFYHDGTWYLYYLNQNFNVRLVTSQDLVHWTPVQLSHTPPGKGTPPFAPYYVLGVFWDETAQLFRSYHGGPNNVMIGHTSTDLVNWDYASREFIIPAQERYAVQRDPYVFWNEDEGQYWVIMTCEVKDRPRAVAGSICYASSKDLVSWQDRGDLYFPGNVGPPEVPQMFKLGDRWYLFASIYENGRVGKSSYWMSNHPTGPWTQAVPDSLDGDDLRAANYGFDGRRWIMFGWIPLRDREAHGEEVWGGHLGFPRELYQLPDGSLAVRLPQEVAERIRGQRLFPSQGEVVTERGHWELGDAIRFVDGSGYGRANLPGTFERIDMAIAFEADANNRYAGIALDSPTGTSGVEILVDRTASRLVIRSDASRGDATAFSSLPLPAVEAVQHLRVIVEEDMVELFANDRYSLAARLPLKMAGMGISLVADGGPVTFRTYDVYWLRGLEEID